MRVPLHTQLNNVKQYDSTAVVRKKWPREKDENPQKETQLWSEINYVK